MNILRKSISPAEWRTVVELISGQQRVPTRSLAESWREALPVESAEAHHSEDDHELENEQPSVPRRPERRKAIDVNDRRVEPRCHQGTDAGDGERRECGHERGQKTRRFLG